MSILFPKDLPEHPDYRPTPSLPAEVAKTVGVPVFAVAVGVYPLCPVRHEHVSIHEHEHVPHDDVDQIHTAIEAGAFGGSSSSSGDDLSWRNNSQDVANEIIRRHWDAQRRAFYTMAQTSSSMSPALMEFASR